MQILQKQRSNIICAQTQRKMGEKCNGPNYLQLPVQISFHLHTIGPYRTVPVFAGITIPKIVILGIVVWTIE